jgi:putative hemolysin
VKDSRLTKSVAFLVLILFIPLVATAACKTPESTTESAPQVEIANPAAAYCVEQGYKNEMRTNPDGSQYGVCIMDDGTECDEWAFYRGECGPGAKPTTTPVPD